MTSRRFEGTYRLHLQGCESVNWLIPRRWRRYVSSKLRQTITQPHGTTTQKICVPNKHSSESSEHCFCVVKMKSATGSSSFYVCWGSRVELNAGNWRNCFFQQGKQSSYLSEKSEVTKHNFSKGLKAKCLCWLSEVKPHLNRRQKIEAHYCREWTTIDHRKFYFPDYMVGGVVRITGEYGPPTGNSVVYIAYKKIITQC